MEKKLKAIYLMKGLENILSKIKIHQILNNIAVLFLIKIVYLN